MFKDHRSVQKAKRSFYLIAGETELTRAANLNPGKASEGMNGTWKLCWKLYSYFQLLLELLINHLLRFRLRFTSKLYNLEALGHLPFNDPKC